MERKIHYIEATKDVTILNSEPIYKNGIFVGVRTNPTIQDVVVVISKESQLKIKKSLFDKILDNLSVVQVCMLCGLYVILGFKCLK
jgi:hypothetical protein